MLLMSARTPIFGLCRRGLRRGGSFGEPGPLIARNLAIKAWHMACVVGRDIVANGESRLGRGDGNCTPKFTWARCNYFYGSALKSALVVQRQCRHIVD
jgi:hypothetical protein